MNNIYDQIAQDFANTRTPNFYKQEFSKLKELLNGGKIIDLGCANGRDAESLEALGYEYLGVDSSKNLIKIAQEQHPNSNFLLADFNELEFPNDSFDGFIAFTSLLHTPKSDLPSTLVAIKRIMKNNAVGLISMKEMNKSWEGIVEENRFGKGIIKRFFAYYSRDEFIKQLTDCGYELIDDYIKFFDDKKWQIYFVKVTKK